jgi:hypothetical protein
LPLAFPDNHQIRDSGSALFANIQNLLITGGTFVVSLSCARYKQLIIVTSYLLCQNNNNLPANTERHTKIPALQKPNSSPLFVGRKDVLETLRKIFIQCADSKLMLRCSCLLWGTGGIRMTQICLKFIEEMTGRLSHVFWVDASSVDSITMSLRGISCIPAAQASCLDDSVVSVLQWLSGIQEEWLIVFDNADDLPFYVVDRFIPPGNQGNMITS